MTLKFTDPEDLKQKTYYLAGQMSGLPQFNIPEFFRVASELRRQGHKILNPAELDTDHCRVAALKSLTGDQSELPKDETWGTILSRDVEIVIEQADGLIVFPNWVNSNGARLEVFTAYLLKKPINKLIDKRGEISIELMEADEIEAGVLH